MLNSPDSIAVVHQWVETILDSKDIVRFDLGDSGERPPLQVGTCIVATQLFLPFDQTPAAVE